jgi:hypothetical protein
VLSVSVGAKRVNVFGDIQILDFYEEVLTALEELLRVGPLSEINF